MLRRRSVKNRFWNLLRSIRFIPGLAAMALSGCASRAVPTSSAPREVTAPTSTVTIQPDVKQDVREQLDPHWWPIDLMFTPDLRAGCRPLVELPSHLVLNDEIEQADKLEPLVACLTLGLPKTRRLHIAGETELAGALAAPETGRAAALRATLAKLGVPPETIQTHRVDSGRSIEVGIEPNAS